MSNVPNETLDRAVAGDQDALADLLEAHGPQVRSRVEPRISRKWRAVLSCDDVMQETYADAFDSITRFVPRGPDSFLAWLTTIAQCNLRDALEMLEAKKRGRDWQRADGAGDADSYVAFCDMLAGTMTSPSHVAARTEARIRLEQALDALSPAYRKVVQMYDLDGRSIEEVTEAVNRTPGAVYMIRARAHRKLREQLGTASRFFTDAT